MIERDYARIGYKDGFGDRLKLSRHNCKCKVTDLAKHVKVSTKTVIAWEKNEMLPTLNQAILISRCLGVSLDFLLRDIPEEYTPKEKELMRAYRDAGEKRDAADDILGLKHERVKVVIHDRETPEQLKRRQYECDFAYYRCLVRGSRKALREKIIAERDRLEKLDENALISKCLEQIRKENEENQEAKLNDKES